MAVKPRPTSSSSSLSSKLLPRRPKRDAKWRAMIKRRNALLKKEQRNSSSVTIIYGVGTTSDNGGGLERSHGVSWVRVSLLGKGSFGSVFFAKRKTPIDQESNLPSQIAVKSATMKQSSSLKHEKDILCNLTSSPYVVRCYGDEVTETDNGEKIYNIILEFCSGLSLGRQIKLSGCRLPEHDVRAYTRDIVRGLKDIHSQGYVHCDIKPGNILLVPGTLERSGGFVAKIADFGLAKSMHEAEDEEEDDYIHLEGTYRYMSPELITEKKPSYPADICALGCTVLEMISGKPAWTYSDVDELLHTIVCTNQLPDIPSNISEDAKDFLRMCLARDATQRCIAETLLLHPFLCLFFVLEFTVYSSTFMHIFVKASRKRSIIAGFFSFWNCKLM